jgi:hypothetical protein
MRDHLRESIGILSSEGATFSITPFKASQEFPQMIGYCLKDQGQEHFRCVTVNISDDEMRDGIHRYGLVRDPLSGKLEITKTNVFKLAHGYYRMNLSPLPLEHMTIDIVLRFMLMTREYYPAASWVMGPNGKGMDWSKACDFWDVITRFNCSPDEYEVDIPLSSVHNIFFWHQKSDPNGPTGMDAEGFGAASLQEVHAQMLRARAEVGYDLDEYLQTQRFRRIFHRLSTAAAHPPSNTAPLPSCSHDIEDGGVEEDAMDVDWAPPSPTSSEERRQAANPAFRAARRERWAEIRARHARNNDVGSSASRQCPTEIQPDPLPQPPASTTSQPQATPSAPLDVDLPDRWVPRRPPPAQRVTYSGFQPRPSPAELAAREAYRMRTEPDDPSPPLPRPLFIPRANRHTLRRRIPEDNGEAPPQSA